jgi:hypothetical protein
MGMRTGPAFLAVTVLLALAGCSPTDSHSNPAPSASATPVFSSDAEALAAAEKAYAAYLKVSISITGDGGSADSRIDTLVTKAQARREHDTYEYFAERGLHTTGAPDFGELQLQQVRYDSGGAADLSFYVCVDSSKVRIVDATGADATPLTRPDRSALEVSMQSSSKHLTELVVAESSTWSGPGICS